MDSCLNCGGAILEIGKVYGYAGKICYCPVDPRTIFQRPASKEPKPTPTAEDVSDTERRDEEGK